MSFDRDLDQVCPHLTIGEMLFVNGDFQTVRPRRAISSTDSVRVRLNGEIEVPSYGVAIPAQSLGSKQGPFRIISGNSASANNKVSFRVNQGSLQTIVLPSSNHLSASQIATMLNRTAQGVTFYDERGRLGFRTNLVGNDSSIFFTSDTTLGSVVGISANREYRGRNTLPGWSLITDVNQVSSRPTRLIVFDEPLKGFNDFVEIDYTTVREDCRRCGGLGVESDWRYARNGETGEVRDEVLLLQEVGKIIYTAEGSNPFHPWYGSRLLDMIGKKLIPNGIFQNLIVQEINTSFSRLQTLKKAQEGPAISQYVSDEEYPLRLISVDIQQSSQDPTVIFVNVTMQNRSLKTINIERGLKLPEPLNLLNSTTASQAVFQQSLRNTKLVSG